MTHTYTITIKAPVKIEPASKEQLLQMLKNPANKVFITDIEHKQED